MKSRILHADDDILFSRIVNNILRQIDLEVFHAPDGKQAWQLFNKIQFDYCLLDVVMPGLNGIELGERIRKVDGNMPICFLSGEDPGWLEREVSTRVADAKFFCKTFNIRSLSLFLSHYLITPPILNQYGSNRTLKI
ncbi:PleD family two-component system response regulator [Chitinophaga eiseniae]|uniref:Response regulator n=1 Tax=Chitinophaga eiseniae TaxID=634771 RepID=A0A847SPD7_9BACT|nr:response regulator [Chitinophaga eiseniae]NLR79129.1 response regulator [Chitinophaga eiseniae]